jgi:hypothetical protein
MKLRLPTLGEITGNWRLKLSALALAVLIWAVVSAEQPTTQWIPVRVEAQVRDPDYVLAGPPDPVQVQVRFSGPGRELWELALDRPRLVLPVREGGDQRTFPLEGGMVRVPPGLSVSVLEIRPQFARLELQRLASRVLPVRARVGAQSLQRYVIGDELEILPAEIRVTGPAERLAALDALTTLRFEIVPDDSTFSQEVQLDTTGMDDLSFNRTRVRVSGAVEVRSERVVSGVAVYVPDGLVARPARVEARVQGGRRTLQGIFAPALRAVVPRDSLPRTIPAEGVEAPVVFGGLPPGTSARATPLRVRVYPQGAPEAEEPAPRPVPDLAQPDSTPAEPAAPPP